MAEITAAAVKALREKTGLPMMDCKQALQENGGDMEQAVDWLRKKGLKTMEKRAGRETSFGRIGVCVDAAKKLAGIVEVQCESAPVTTNPEFMQLVSDLAAQLVKGPGAATPDELLAQPSASKPGITLKAQFEDLTNRIREVFRLARIERVAGQCGSYVHHNGASGVLLVVEGDNPSLAKDICMHTAALRPMVAFKEQLDPALVAREREILAEAARKEGKPEAIIAKMVEGRLKNFYAERCLAEQPFVKDDSKSVGKVAEEGGLKIVRYLLWEVGKE